MANYAELNGSTVSDAAKLPARVVVRYDNFQWTFKLQGSTPSTQSRSMRLQYAVLYYCTLAGANIQLRHETCFSVLSRRGLHYQHSSELVARIAPAIGDIREVMNLLISETYTSALCVVLLQLIESLGGRDNPVVAPLHLQSVTSKK